MATAEELIDEAANRVDEYADQAAAFISDLQEFVDRTNFNIRVPGGNSISLTSAAGTLLSEIQTGRPVAPNLSFNTPVSPGSAPSDFDIREAEQLSIPTFAETPPAIDIPTRPILALPSEPTAPSVRDITLPASPTVTLPSVPTLIAVDFPSVPTLQLPTFTESFPVAPDLLLSQTTFTYDEDEYSNEVLDAISATLLADINDGGFGITPADEESLYERQKDREIWASRKREGEIIDMFASKGHLLPTGTLLSLLESNKQETMNKLSDANRDVSVNRAELLRRGREFAITQGLSLNQSLLQYFGFKQERALGAQKFAAEFGINVVDFQIRRYNAYIQGYAAYTASYAEEIRAALTRAEIFKTQIEAAVAKQQSNQLQIDVYRAQIEATTSIVGLFETQMRAAALEAEVERNKIQMFEAQIKAFLGQVDARKSQVELYNSAIRGELAKSEIYQSQVSAYDSQVKALATRASIQNMNIQSDIKRSELELASYGAKMEKYKADLQNELGRLNTLVSSAQVDSEIFRGVLSGLEAVLSSDNQLKEMFIRSVHAENQLDQEQAKVYLQQLVAETEVKLGAATTGANVFNNLVTAAMSSVNTLASVEE